MKVQRMLRKKLILVSVHLTLRKMMEGKNRKGARKDEPKGHYNERDPYK